MNVNPFSYLIEKLKSKVSKSGDTMSGNLTVDRRNGTAGTEGYSGIILGNNVPYTQNENSTGYARFFTKNGYSIDVYAKHAPSNNQEIILPESDGTLALKSDIDIKGQSVTFSPYISDAGYIKTWKMGKMYFISFNAPINPCSADTVLISGYPNTIQRFYGLLGADDGTNIRIELKNGELVTNNAVTAWKWYAGNIFFYES